MDQKKKLSLKAQKHQTSKLQTFKSQILNKKAYSKNQQLNLKPQTLKVKHLQFNFLNIISFRTTVKLMTLYSLNLQIKQPELEARQMVLTRAETTGLSSRRPAF